MTGHPLIVLGEIDQLVRSGHLEAAVPQLPKHRRNVATGEWRNLTRGLRRDGLVPEADLIEIVLEHPAVLTVIPKLRLAAIIVAVIPGALLATQMGALALLPAIAIGVLTFESQRARVLRRTTPTLMAAQRDLVSDYLDLSIYLAGDLQMTRWVTVGCATIALLFMAGGTTLAITEADHDATTAGATLVLAGLATLVATLMARVHVRDLEFRRPFPSFGRPIMSRRERRVPTAVADRHAFRNNPDQTRARTRSIPPTRISFPTPGRTLLQVIALLAACAIAAATIQGTAVIVISSAVATIALLRAANTSVSVDDDQIRIVTILITRTIPLSTIQSARTPATASDGHRWTAPRLDLVFLDERTRTIAATGIGSQSTREFQWPAGSRAGRIVAAAERINNARARRTN